MQYDIFISYSHKDDRAAEGKHGWVDSFHIALFGYLTQKLGRDAKIWRDETEMRANYALDSALSENVAKSLIFLPILSPSYLNSEYCLKELDEFCRQENVFQGVQTRVFPVEKLPLKKPPPPQIEGNLRTAFFRKDDFGKQTVELDPSLGDKRRDEFNQKITDLAGEIADFIESVGGNLDDEAGIKEVQKPPPVPPDANVPLVYLAEPSFDLFDKYLEIKRDLEERKIQGKIKFDLLPRELPREATQIFERNDEAEAYERKIKEDIARSRLTVHIIGRQPNKFPPESGRSYLHLETEAAAARDGQPEFNRLVWIPKSLYPAEELRQPGNERHKAFIKRIRETSIAGDGLMQDSFEAFKERIQEVLKPKPPPPVPPPPTDEPCVYVLSDQSDLGTVVNLEKELKEQGCSIFSTRDYWGDPEMDVYHRQYLCDCDAVLIYWRTTRVPWVKIKAQELKKTKGYGRSENFLGRGVFWDGDIAGRDEYFFSDDLEMVKGYEHLPRFVSRIKSNKEAAYQ